MNSYRLKSQQRSLRDIWSFFFTPYLTLTQSISLNREENFLTKFEFVRGKFSLKFSKTRFLKEYRQHSQLCSLAKSVRSVFWILAHFYANLAPKINRFKFIIFQISVCLLYLYIKVFSLTENKACFIFD